MDIPSFQIALQSLAQEIHTGKWKNQETDLSQRVQSLLNDSNKDVYTNPEIRGEITHLTQELQNMETPNKEIINSVVRLTQQVLQPATAPPPPPQIPNALQPPVAPQTQIVHAFNDVLALVSDSKKLQKYIDDGGDIKKSMEFGVTALHVAALCNAVTALPLLLEAGVAVNQEDNFGETALYCAAKHGHSSVIKALIDAGADLNKAYELAKKNNNKEALTALETASTQKALRDLAQQINSGQYDGKEEALVETVNSLFSDSNQGAPELRSEIAHLIKALSQMKTQNGLKTVFALINKAGFSIDEIDEEGDTALYHAVKNHNDAAITMLLEAGADPYKAYSWAIAKGDTTTIAAFENSPAFAHRAERDKTRQLQDESHATGSTLFDTIAIIENNGDPKKIVAELKQIRTRLEKEKENLAGEIAWSDSELAYDESWALGSLLRSTGLFNQRTDQELKKLVETKMKQDLLDQEIRAIKQKISDWESIQKITQFRKASKHMATWDKIEITNYLSGATRHASPEKTAYVNSNAVFAKSKAKSLFGVPFKGSEKSDEFNFILGKKTIDMEAGRCFAVSAAVALTLLQDPEITEHIEIAGTNRFNHAFVIVGRANYDPNKPDKGLNDLANWGDGAFVVDVWQANQKTSSLDLQYPLIYDPQHWLYSVGSVERTQKFPNGALVSTLIWKAENRKQDKQHAEDVLRGLEKDAA